MPTEYLFTGQRREVTTGGLYHIGARFYDPNTNRFISPDSIVPKPQNPPSFNRYSYALGNPLKYRDPSGHWVETAWDIANIVWDIYEIKQDPSLLNVGALVLDVAAVALPAVPAGAGLIARGGKAAKTGIELSSHADEAIDVAKGLSLADDMARAVKPIDEGVAAYRAHRGGGIHPASTGKAFSDWFKETILKNPAAKGMNIWNGKRRLDVVDEVGGLVADRTRQIYELENYTVKTGIGKRFWSQASDYSHFAEEAGYSLNYVFGQKIADSVAQRLIELDILVWFIDDAGRMKPWKP